jgi:hypothetical protein
LEEGLVWIVDIHHAGRARQYRKVRRVLLLRENCDPMWCRISEVPNIQKLRNGAADSIGMRCNEFKQREMRADLDNSIELPFV